LIYTFDLLISLDTV